MKMKYEEKNKWYILLIIVLVIVIAFVIGICVVRQYHSPSIHRTISGKDSEVEQIPEVEQSPKVDVVDEIINQVSTEKMTNQTPLIDMDNTENVKIQNGEKVNSSQYVKEEKEIEGLKFTNIQLHTRSGLSVFNATVENTTDEAFERKIVKLVFKNSDGSVFATLEALIPAMEAKGTATMNASTTADIVNAGYMEIEF